MNWVGGSRNRFAAKNDAKKQREFFEKRKMQHKLKNLGMAVPDSPRGTSSGGMDLVTLFIVNQIAAKKEIKGGSKHKRNEPLVLPMSPCSPSQLSLVEGEPQWSAQEQRKRKHLSPVPESAFSDNSAADYLPPMTGPLSPFSSTSSASDQGIFPLQLNLQQRSQPQLPRPCSLPLWDSAVLGHTEPFSQPRDMTDCIPWSCAPDPPLFQLETPTAAHVLFRSPERRNTEAWDQAGREVTFSLGQLEDKEPVLDFTLHREESQQRFEGEVFRGFSTGECDEEVAACLEHSDGHANGSEYSAGCSCSGGYLSSDSDDDEECRQPPGLQAAASSHVDRVFCADGLDSCTASQGSEKQRLSKPRPVTPLLNPGTGFRDNQEVTGNAVVQVKGWASNAPPALAQSQSSEPCACKKTPAETREAGTQTAGNLAAETRDTWTQCGGPEAGRLDARPPPVDVSVRPPATGRQTDTAAEPRAHTPPSHKWGSGEKHTPWTRTPSNETIGAGSSFVNKSADGRAVLQRPRNPFLEALGGTDGGGKDDGEDRGQQGNGRLMKSLSDEAMEEVTSGTAAHGLSEEAETLQEIADILLLLKRRKEVTQ
ncbi:putative protein C12orf40 [Liparis tanakae]|uniref:Uncharacterized protein n=1 Tax=Liparis tanakae TaxID=230148 RepID=A0A4Z2GQY5_9TELE|nr:putative protein C12orf40 [Liparis tanakae]